MPFGCAAPIFRVASLKASLEYYVNVLGFTIDWEDPASIASVSRDRCCLFLCEGDQGNAGSWTWIGVGDAEALYGEYTSKRAKVRNPPSNFKWALEMQIEDLDGNVLRMGSEPKQGPFGPWRDMNGDLWFQEPDGRWTRR
jgi:catechol 2,3-dioxygenase-like lactoylglutathione lyase family enzyme